MAIERTLGPFITKQGEFYYSEKEDNKNIVVREDQEYYSTISYSKKVIYILSATKRSIVKAKKDTNILASYKNARPRDNYPKKRFLTSAKLLNAGDIITRIFAQNKISDENEIFEVEKTTNSTIYKYAKIRWKIGGTIEEAREYNTLQLNRITSVMSGIKDMLPVDQLHKTKIENLLYKKPAISAEDPEST